MVQGNLARGEYWIDCNHILESHLRSVFGGWIILCVAVIAISARTVYCSRITRRLLSNNHDKRFVSLWDVSPASNPAEVFELRRIIFRSAHKRNIPYLIASTACVAAAILSAASTSIANHTIAKTPSFESDRSRALATAQAPLDQLFDFIPDDASDWVYVQEEWNNTWTGTCAFHTYPAVDLVVYPTNSSSFQDEATVDPTRQGTMYSGYRYIESGVNNTGAWRDKLVSYAFGSSPNDNVDVASTINISFANFLAHQVGRDLYSDGFEQTAFKSDVHVVECTLDNSAPGIEDQAFPEGGQYDNAITNVAGVYTRSVTDSAVSQLPVVQPTGQEMFRNWQAFMSVKDGEFPHIVKRAISVAAPVVQMRLSVLLVTTGGFTFALLAAFVSRLTEPRDELGKRIELPASQLDWMVQAAREHERGAGMRDDGVTTTRSPSTFAAERNDLMFGMALAPGGVPSARIISPALSPNEIAQPSLAYLNPLPPDMKSERSDSTLEVAESV
ncbi:hypothetical protein BD410DRAFT_805374 [Rickenella mellea]|uniref:Uncharacterized protein n=1 Tax=Rickenella mellea TaxID=50990 RepID=A0A4Y7PXW1_9AGAM|nr:hypothetical protein BD410DRAFT_805374 [Rickenella mellea]